MSAYRLIDAEKASYPISLLCRVLRVSRSGYYAWNGRPPSERDRENAALTEKIREIHSRSRQIYGYPRVHAELRALGVRCSRKRVARLMRKAGLRGCMRRRKRCTTHRDKHAIAAPDLVNRNFAAIAPDSSGRRTSLTSALKKALCILPSSSTSTPGRWWAGRWQPTLGQSLWWMPWRWPSGGGSPTRG